MASRLMIDLEPGLPERRDDFPGPEDREAFHFELTSTSSRSIRGGRFTSRGNGV